MQAVEFRLSIPKYLLARGIGRRLPELHTNKVFGQVALRDVTDPVLPGPDWLALEPVLAGVCGTDLGTIAGRTSPALAPFSSFPAVLGHEVVARVAVVGEAVEGFAPGERVVVDPWISCTVRDLSRVRRAVREGRTCAAGLRKVPSVPVCSSDFAGVYRVDGRSAWWCTSRKCTRCRRG